MNPNAGWSSSSSTSTLNLDMLGYFPKDEEGFYHVYTDGSCPGNGRHGATGGIGVWFSDNNCMNVSEPIPYGYPVTNQVAEILAVRMAAQQASSIGIKKLHIYTDSKYVINSLTEWMPKWRINGWRSARRKPLVNKRELREMDDALKPLIFRVEHVTAHSGNYGNERADELAKNGAAKARRSYN